MVYKFIVFVGLLVSAVTAQNHHFAYNGFQSSNLTIDGIAEITSSGLLMLTNSTKQQKGHAFYPFPLKFKNDPNGTASSFSTTFVIGIQSEYPTLSGHGITFAISPTRDLSLALPSQYLGLFNSSNNGNETNHIIAVELDTIFNSEFSDINDNHVGLDINGLKSNLSLPAGYYEKSGKFTNLTLISGKPMQVWFDYDGVSKKIEVTLAPFNGDKPNLPLLSLQEDLSNYLLDSMYVGFSSSTGSTLTSHYVLGWSFAMNGEAQRLYGLPKLPRIGPKQKSRMLTIGLPVLLCCSIVCGAAIIYYGMWRRKKFAEELEDWEQEYGPQRFKYKELYMATRGFRDLLGKGGFGSVYRGTSPVSKAEIAVKRVSHQSKQGLKQFVAEVVSIGQLRHRNLVPLLGYCRRKGELLLVYDYMPNGSLDKFIHDKPAVTLNWAQRFRVIKGVASGLLYLHEEWEQTVIHRDVKASNVLLDGELNGRLGDFGLARLYHHGTDPQTTHVVGTLGYLAPEHTRTGKTTTGMDVFAYGAFLLEVVCGRRPTDLNGPNCDLILVDWVDSLLYSADVLEARDPNLGSDFDAEEIELVLKLGLMCSSSEAGRRPTMRQVVQYLERDAPLPQLAPFPVGIGGAISHYYEGFDEFADSYPSTASFSSSTVHGLLSSHDASGR